MNHQYKSYMTGIILAAMAMPAYAAAADTAQADTQNLLSKDVVVTATRTEAEIKTVPNTVEVITAEDIQKLGATDVYSALRLADNIQIMNTSTGFGHRVSMRGMASNQTLILINGQRTAIEDTATTQNLLALDRINVNTIERIEIVRGAASAQYGSDALAGVINIITKKSTGKPSVTVGATTGTTNMQNYYHIDLGKQGKFSGVFDMDFSKDRQWTEHNVSGLPIKNLQGPKQNYRFSGTYELGKDKNLNLDLGYYKDKLTGDWSHKEYNTGAWGGIIRLQDAKLETERRDASLSLTGKNKKAMRHAFMERMAAEAVGFRRYLDYLSAIVTIAPLLGLLGTVTGMINTFSILDNGAGAAAITGGVGEALVATASGLCVAILAFCVYTYFSHQLDVIVTDTEGLCADVLNAKKESWGRA